MGIDRGKPPKKVGLVLGSGAARGLAHIGVLKAFEQEGIPIDVIAGASIGALVGALYTHGEPVEHMGKLAIDIGAKRFSFMVDPSLPTVGLLRGRRLEGTLKAVLRNVRFSDLRIPFACVATDIYSGEEVVFRRGWFGMPSGQVFPYRWSLTWSRGATDTWLTAVWSTRCRCTSPKRWGQILLSP
ncbi:MAG: patatin-like phospholipase family protein [Chloroflexi bacterium]|nr:patatin-like phospholipase family protein [Chloroflexota bacterium]